MRKHEDGSITFTATEIEKLTQYVNTLINEAGTEHRVLFQYFEPDVIQDTTFQTK